MPDTPPPPGQFFAIGRVHRLFSPPFATFDEATIFATARFGLTGEIHDVVRKDGKVLTITWRADEGALK